MKSLFQPILVMVLLSIWAMPNLAQASKELTPSRFDAGLDVKMKESPADSGSGQRRPVIAISPEDLKSMTLDTLMKQKDSGGNIRFKVGGGDAGGGDTVQNVTVEKLRKKTSELVEYEKFVAPVIRQIESDIPGFAEALRERAENLSWYILPVQFENLPFEFTELISVTDQSAVQIKNEVFVDEAKWLGKNPKQRADLILHEIVEAQYFFLRNDPEFELKNPGEQVSMSDFRAISNLAQGYESAKADEVQKQLFERNFGFYISKALANEWSRELQGNMIFLKDQICSESKIQEAKLSALLPVLIVLKVEFATCSVYPFACANMTKVNQKHKAKFFSGLPAWAHLSQIYPKRLLPEITENSVKENFEDFFDRLYPGLRNQPEDLQLGQDVCAKAKTLKLDRLVYGFGK